MTDQQKLKAILDKLWTHGFNSGQQWVRVKCLANDITPTINAQLELVELLGIWFDNDGRLCITVDGRTVYLIQEDRC